MSIVRRDTPVQGCGEVMSDKRTLLVERYNQNTITRRRARASATKALQAYNDAAETWSDTDKACKAANRKILDYDATPQETTK